MKKILTLIIVVVLAAFEAYQGKNNSTDGDSQEVNENTTRKSNSTAGKGNSQKNSTWTSFKAKSTLQQAYKNRQSDIQIQGEGIVAKVLRDDLEGSRHQKFILKAGGGKTVLVAHNIDLAPRVEGLRKGDRIEYYGEYEWDARGGIIHWTHKDPKGYHTGGWLKHNGKTYQ